MSDTKLGHENPLSALNLSVRAANALEAGGFTTVEQVEKATDRELLSLKSLGPTSLSQVRDEIERFRAMQRLHIAQHQSAHSGGPAFPVNFLVGDGFVGATLRDYFAAKAMQSVYERFDISISVGTHQRPVAWREGLAREAYLMADAMLAARGEIK